MPLKIDWWEILDVLCWGVTFLGCPSAGRILDGFDNDRYRDREFAAWRRLEKKGWVRRRGEGAAAQVQITDLGRQQCAMPDPRASWEQPWDKKWRLVTFDVPVHRRKDRLLLWRALRARKLGYLQQSVWVWPRDIEPILREIIQAKGIPECFAGFECTRLFLCTNEEVVRTAWDCKRISHAHEAYLKEAAQVVKGLRAAGELGALAPWARRERLAYQAALEEDPLLPRALWPEGYRGREVWQAHAEARAALATQLRRLLADGL